ncbi:ferredoxin [Candidatus Woesearchaeota archaeon]|nr:ferredoxin [Candidatus Woesearchaeota archaeon]
MTKYKIVLDRANCIGAFSCVAVGGGEDIWQMDDDGKVNLKLAGATRTPELHEFITEDEALVKKVIATGEVCPVAVIKVINMDTGENLVK